MRQRCHPYQSSVKPPTGGLSHVEPCRVENPTWSSRGNSAFALTREQKAGRQGTIIPAADPAVLYDCSTQIHTPVAPRAYLCSHSSGWKESLSQNRFSILYGQDTDCADAQKKRKSVVDRCARSFQLRRKAQKIVRLLAVDQSLKAVRPLPSDFVCGSLRTKIRSIYSELTPVQELSIKTAQKAEVQPCRHCEDLQGDKLNEWKSARLSPAESSEEDLSAFGRAFSDNVPKGWNNRKRPYIPNGHGSLTATRKAGGNWVDEPFSSDANVKLVYSSGKPRIVTLYSSHNVSVLTPLHHSLYSYLRERSWLLVGSPTSERLRDLQSGCSGDEWLSFDYIGATDNIKTAYVQRAVEILIEKGEDLSIDEVRCLRVLSSLTLGHEAATTGQPMGSPMSFPLLCLFNKTIVDMALTSMLERREIPFKEWTVHRCLINGDDLLTRSTSRGDLVAAVMEYGGKVGMKTNPEKTMRSPEFGEINSTVFRNCVLEKKTNVSALWMAQEVCDSLAYAEESSVTRKGFALVACGNATRLARQKIKTITELPMSRKKIVMSTKKLRDALSHRPSSKVPTETNLFPVEVVKFDFTLTREEESRVLEAEVASIKERKAWVPLYAQKRKLERMRKHLTPVYERKPLRKLWESLTPDAPDRERRTLSCFARYWENKRKEELLAEETHDRPAMIVSDLSGIGAIVDSIRAWRIKKGVRPITLQPTGCPFSKGDGYVSFTDE